MARLLLVEDDHAIRIGVEATLRTSGYIIESMQTAEDAVDYLSEAVPDLIISDVVLPGRSGLDLLRFVREDSRLRSVPVLLISASITVELRDEIIRTPDVHFLHKPFSPSELATIVGQLLPVETQ